MDSLDQKLELIEDSAERFPQQMLLVREVFSFSFDDASIVSTKLQSQAELIAAIEDLRSYINASDLPDEQKQILEALLLDEEEVILYSQSSRCSVISL